ncbi:Rrf2 family transcriptional regulator [Streptomyces griseoluteus]|uniref:Rrf2 family transcriptional regulator n=1 Tax=Streptomyces TaxID=1883 RepID=UPI000A3ABBE9|nr:Rrf2 family transcriptional regulator [Streptomyces recifensis]
MSANSRLTIAVHVLTWMALDRQQNEVATSERIAGSVNTNPVLIRRCLGELREAGLVQARRGGGAGWTLLREPEAITLLDVYLAVDDGEQFGLHHTAPNSECPIGFGIQPVLSNVYRTLDENIRQELSRTTIADVLKDTLAKRDA